MGRPAAKELTERELEVMQVFWKLGELTAAEARDRLAEANPELDRNYVTIANLVRGLHEKGFLRPVNTERPFQYRPVRSFEEVSGRLLGELLERVFGGSRTQTPEATGRAAKAQRRGTGAARRSSQAPAPGEGETAMSPGTLEMGLFWSSVQVALVLVPAAVAHGLATRRGASEGAWAAGLGLSISLVLAVTTLVFPGGILPRLRGVPMATPAPPPLAARPAEGTTNRDIAPTAGVALEAVLRRLQAGWNVPVRTMEGRGRWLAPVVLAAMTIALARLLVELGALALCWRRSRPVDDPELLRLLEELRGVLGLRSGQRVELRVLHGLTSPATAGWLRPLIFLPEDWPSWDQSERRSVLAHELAHIQRGDYAMGLLARAALVLNIHQPLAHWLARRLLLQQELAADALAAQAAGGNSLYIQALSRMALRQDGAIPSPRFGPARAFLAARGTLIRRIGMLRDETCKDERVCSKPRRVLTFVMLGVIALGAAALRSPARAGDAPKLEPEPGKLPAFDLTYLPEDARGFIALRPAAVMRRAGSDRLGAKVNQEIAGTLATVATEMGLGPTTMLDNPLNIEKIEQMTVDLNIMRTNSSQAPHRLVMQSLTVRMTEPFDWITRLRAWKIELTEVQDEATGRVYYQGKNLGRKLHAHVYCPDDRTLVFSFGPQILKLIRRPEPKASAWVANLDWDRLRDSLCVVAMDNREDGFTAAHRGDVLEGFDVSSLFDQARVWTFALDDADTVSIQAIASCPTEEARLSTARAVNALLAIGKRLTAPPANGEDDLERQLLTALSRAARVEQAGSSVLVRSTGGATLADLAAALTRK